MKKLASLSLFFPAYNDAKILPSLIHSAYLTAKRVAHRHEIIIVNDGSSDNTQEVILRLQKKYKTVRFVLHKKNSGYGGALISGFKAARYEWIFYTDGDGQYNPVDLIKLVSFVKPTIDVINGYKLNRDDSWMRKLVGNIYNQGLHKIYPLPIRDVDCDFRLIRSSLLKNITLKSQSGSICVELVVKLNRANAKFAEVGVHHHPRKYGSSHFFTAQNLLKTAQENWLLYKSLH